MSQDEQLRWLWLACRVARALGDDVSWDELTDLQVRIARQSGALAVLPIALTERFSAELFAGKLASAISLAAELAAVTEATGAQLSPHIAFLLATWRGREAEALALIDVSRQDVAQRGEGLWLIATEWTSAVFFNGLGRYEEALASAERAAEHPFALGLSTWVCPELIEAAARSGHAERGTGAMERLTDIARAAGTDWALGIEARARAMLSEGPAADALYREAIERLGRTRIRVTLARAHLLYGEWLRREGRRVDAREQLRTAHDMLTDMGMAGFVERASRELLATGETVRKRSVDAPDDLTPQETQIARLAGEGRTNPEIGAELFISPRTVEWHLRKVYGKLGVSSRRELRRQLAPT
jgi:DNA-binding CsgD family transcriptional regulator